MHIVCWRGGCGGRRLRVCNGELRGTESIKLGDVRRFLQRLRTVRNRLQGTYLHRLHPAARREGGGDVEKKYAFDKEATTAN